MLKHRPFGEARAAGKRKAPFKALTLPYSGYYAYIIIGVTVIVYILQLIFPGLTGFLQLSAQTLLSHPWGLVTSIFLHDPRNIFHIFLNMLALFFFGPLLERRIGSKSFLALYLGSGILAGLVQVIVFPSSAVVGASGAIFGVLGALTVMMPDLVVILYFVPLKIVYLTILFVILDLFPMLTGAPDGIAHAAHLAGLAIGMAAGFWYRQKSKVRNARWQV
jgi:membrane associated rhomboid family serine protease